MSNTSPSQIVRILVIDDDFDDFQFTKKLISDIADGNFLIEWCDNYKQGITSILNSAYDIYFIDHYLGIKTGIDLLKEAMQVECKDPIILLTGQGNPKLDKEAMNSGVADYLIKSELTSEKLERCIRYALERASNLELVRTNEKKFRKIFNRSKDVIFLSNQNLKLNDINSAGGELFGYPLSRLIQMSLFDLMLNSHEKNKLAVLLTSKKEIIDFELVFQTEKLQKRDCLLSVSYESDAVGDTYVQGIIRDISLIKKIDEIKLQSTKLEEKGVIIRTLAHEIRNPLQNITLALGFLKNNIIEENREFLTVIERNSKTINDLVNELMDSNQYHKMKLKVMSLQVIINEAVQKASDRIVLSNTVIKLSYPEKDAQALVDKEKLIIAFLNVIINAIEATAKNEGSFRKSEILISIISNADYHKIIIEDNGCGMSDDVSKNLFEPYFTMKPNGIGLGLTVTFAIIQSHKAGIKVSSVPGQGSAFEFSFHAL